MAEYIKREDVLKILSEKNAPWNGYVKCKELPAEDVQPVKWIPVTDRLPDDEMTVLAYCAEDDFYYISRQHRSFSDYDVTHWIPIPEPPKDGEEDV